MISLNKTFLPKQNYKNQNWFIIDCKNQKLGRLATIIVKILKGKAKPTYFPSIDMGDFLILINAKYILINEKNQRWIVNNPGRPGHSLKIKAASECLPKMLIELAVKGMLAKSETKRLMKRLRIFNDEKHTHTAQNPTLIDIKDSGFYLII